MERALLSALIDAFNQQPRLVQHSIRSLLHTRIMPYYLAASAAEATNYVPTINFRDQHESCGIYIIIARGCLLAMVVDMVAVSCALTDAAGLATFVDAVTTFICTKLRRDG
jgi:hypothetical protein